MLINYKFYIGETMCIKENVKMPERGVCTKCGFVSSQDICKACMLLEGLNRGLPKLGIGKSSKANKALASLSNPKSLNF
jgi:cytoplasmic tRNA 2-thiolation protein 1